ncbi:MAG: hypothetical protein IT355_12115 [Gemmatimonadaceae bacterium]|nr:hypothetical protein [Gemmatimonadaceae bacterium]
MLTLDQQLAALQRQYGVTLVDAIRILRGAPAGRRPAPIAPPPISEPPPAPIEPPPAPIEPPAGALAVYHLLGRVASGKNHGIPVTVGPRCPVCHRAKPAGVRKSAAAAAWAATAVPALRQQHRGAPPFPGPVQLTVILRGPLEHPHSVDGDNAEAALLDALTAAGILEDDRPRVLRTVTWTYEDAPDWSQTLIVVPRPDLPAPQPRAPRARQGSRR